MSNSSTVLVIAARAEAETGLDVAFAELAQQNLLCIKLVNFRACHKWVTGPLL